MRYTIAGRLPGLNEVIAVAQRNRYGYGAFKKKETARCAWATVGRIPKITKPIHIEIWWYEPNTRRDIDNICGGGQKFILDGLVEAGKLPNDDQKWVKAISHHFPDPDKKNPRVEVSIEEL